MSNRYANLVGTNKIKDEYTKINTGFDLVQNEIDAEILNRTNADQEIVDSVTQANLSRQQSDDAITSRINTHVNSTTEKHVLSGITNDSTVIGASAKVVVESLQGQISSISAAGANAQIGVYAVSTTGTNTLTSTFTGLTYYAGMKMNWSVTADNTGAVTHNLNSLGAKNVYKVVLNVKTALSPRDLRIGEIAQAQYDGTDFILLNGNRNEEYSATVVSTSGINTLPATSQGLIDEMVVKGRTDTNILTDAVAGCESTSGWTGTGTLATDSANKLEGTNCLKLTLDATSERYQYYNITTMLTSGKYYLITAYVKKGTLTGSGVRLRYNSDDTASIYTSYSTSDSYIRIGLVIAPTDFDTATYASLYFYMNGNNAEYGFIDAIQLQEISATDYALGVTALLDKYTWHLGVKSVDKIRVKSVGKNLFDGKNATLNYYINYNTGALSILSTGGASTDYIRIKPSTNYIISGQLSGHTGGASGSAFYDKNKNFISGFNTAVATQSPANAEYIRCTIGSTTSNLSVFQLEQSATATTYETYQQSQSVCPLPLRAVPSVQDTWDSIRGKHVQNVKEYTLLSGDITLASTTATNVDIFFVQIPTDIKTMTINTVDGIVLLPNSMEIVDTVYDSLANINKYYSGDTRLRYLVTKGTSLATVQSALAGTKIYYQLTTPITTYLQPSVLQTSANGTIYQERFVEDYGFYNSGLALTDSTKLIANLVEVRKWNINDGSYVIIPNSSVTLTTGVITSITSAVAGEFYSFDYNYDDALSLNGELNYSYPVNTIASLKLNTENILTLDTKVNNLAKSYERLSQGYEDLQFLLSAGKVPGSNFPAFETFTTNTNEYSFAVNDYIDLSATEPPHDHKLGQTSVDFHLHTTAKAANATGANRYAKFTIYIGYVAIDGVWTETNITAELTIPTGTLALTNMFLLLPGFNLSNVGIGGQIKVRVKRIAATGGTEYASSIFATQLGLHYISDSLGSLTPTIK